MWQMPQNVGAGLHHMLHLKQDPTFTHRETKPNTQRRQLRAQLCFGFWSPPAVPTPQSRNWLSPNRTSPCKSSGTSNRCSSS